MNPRGHSQEWNVKTAQRVTDRCLVFGVLHNFFVCFQFFDVVVQPCERVGEGLGKVDIITIYKIVVICERKLVEDAIFIIKGLIIEFVVFTTILSDNVVQLRFAVHNIVTTSFPSKVFVFGWSYANMILRCKLQKSSFFLNTANTNLHPNFMKT